MKNRHKLKVEKDGHKYEFVGEGNTPEAAREDALSKLKLLKLDEQKITIEEDKPINY